MCGGRLEETYLLQFGHRGSWTTLVPETVCLVVDSQSNLEKGRPNTDLVTASQNKSRPFDKQRDWGGVNIQHLRWMWVRDTKSQKKCDLGHMFDPPAVSASVGVSALWSSETRLNLHLNINLHVKA